MLQNRQAGGHVASWRRACGWGSQQGAPGRPAQHGLGAWVPHGCPQAAAPHQLRGHHQCFALHGSTAEQGMAGRAGTR